MWTIQAAGAGCVLCVVRFAYSLFDPSKGNRTIWFYYSPHQTTSIQGPSNNDKTRCSHTGNLKLHFLISRLCGGKYGNDIHAGNNQKARNKVCCKSVWTVGSVVHLHTVFEHTVARIWMVWKVTSKFTKSGLNKHLECHKSSHGKALILTLGACLLKIIDQKDDWPKMLQRKAWLIYKLTNCLKN